MSAGTQHNGLADSNLHEPKAHDNDQHEGVGFSSSAHTHTELHEHTDLTAVNKISESGGQITFDGDFVAPQTTDDLTEGSTNLYMSGAEKAKLAGVEALADVTDAANVASSGAVMNTGDETVAGVKTFSSSPIVPTPTTNMQTATKLYVDDHTSGESVLTTRGDILTRDASSKIRLPAGSAGTFLGSDGTDVDWGGVDTEDVAYSSLHDHIKTMQDVINHVWSAGGCGTGFDVTEVGDGTINITAGSAVLRSTDSPHGELNGYALDAVTGMTFVDGKTNYILADYNAGSPELLSTDNLALVFGDQTTTIIYAVNRLGTALNIVDFRSSNVDFIRKNNIKTAQVYGTEHASGALIADLGSQEFSVTAGSFYLLNSNTTTPALDTSVAGVFEYVYSDGSSGWTRVASSTAINGDYYDDGSGTLAEIGNAKFGAHFVYCVLNTPSHYKVVYGTGSYSSLAEAQAVGVPSDLPTDLDVLSTAEFIGKIITKKSTTAFEDIQSPYTEILQTALATTHNAMAGLQGGEVDQYYHSSADRIGAMLLNGFDRYDTDSMPDITFTSGTRTISAAVKGGQSSFKFWANNTQYTKTTTQTVVLPDVTGAYYTYFDNSGVLQYGLASSAVAAWFTHYAIASLTYWNASDGSYLLNPDELHGIDASGIWHMEHHLTEGGQLAFGAEIQGLANASATYTQSTASLAWDEDIPLSTAANSTGHIMLYRFGTDGAWRQTSADLAVGHKEGGDTYYSWNEKVGGTTWGWTEGGATTDYWITFFILAPGGVIKIAGQSVYATRSAAREAIETEVDNIETDGLPMYEIIWLGAIICKRDGTLQDMADGSVFYSLANRGAGTQSPSGLTSYAEDVPTSVTNFDGALSSADINVQLALDTIDNNGIPSNPNLLINADGTDPEDQRGSLPATSVTSGVVTIDRWYAGHNCTQVDMAVQSGGSTRLTCVTAGAGSYVSLEQRIEGYEKYAGKSLTMSAWVKSNSSASSLRLWDGATYFTSNLHTGGGGLELLTVTANIGSSPTLLRATILLGTPSDAEYFEFEWMKLEVGSVATPFVADLPGVNLAKCQRYFYRLTNGIASDRIIVTGVQYTSATQASVDIVLPEAMASFPTVSDGGSSWIFIHGDLAGTITGISSTLDATDASHITLTITGTGFSGTSGSIYNQNTGGEYIDFNAEL